MRIPSVVCMISGALYRSYRSESNQRCSVKAYTVDTWVGAVHFTNVYIKTDTIHPLPETIRLM